MSKIQIQATAAAAAFVVAMSLGCTRGGMNDDDSGTFAPRTVPSASASTEEKAPSKPVAGKTTKPVSAEQRNAALSAQSYLSGESGFSRKGLIGQLKYEGYGVPAATAAVDSLGVDWNAQAALKARNYLDGQAFSRKGLINQLKYEGFTSEQATYGVKQAGL